MNTVKIKTKDGVVLTATVFNPEVPFRAGVIINSATAVRQSYYYAFANYLMANGYVVITYDYRSIGESLTGKKDKAKLTMRNWGEQDFEAIINWTAQEYPELDWHCIGHSVGGQLPGLAASSKRLKSIYCVASQNGYWGHWSIWQKPKLLLTWYVLVPFFTNTVGYLPGFIIGGERLPKGIAKEWARWCRHPEFISDNNGQPIREHFHGYTNSIKFIAIDDDHAFAPIRSVKALHDMYSDARRELKRINPKSVGAKEIGHFGFFRRKFKETLWADSLLWLRSV